MARYSDALERRRLIRHPQSRRRYQAREQECRPIFGIYLGVVPVSRSVANDRFARLVKRVLDAAHERGLTDKDIAKMTGVGTSTFHRWQSNQIGASGPQPEKVRQFFEGLGVQVKVAFDMLGWASNEVVAAEPEPDIPPDVKELLRRLRDPNVPKREKEFIAETIKSLIARPRPNVGAAKK